MAAACCRRLQLSVVGFCRVSNFCSRYYGNGRRLVLGIETSCDDTGAAVVDDNGTVLGEALNSQQQIHLEHGGIIPPIARNLHAQHLPSVVDTALKRANVTLWDLDAIATTVKPGLALSLLIGMRHGKKLAQESGKPFIPIHHMEAHALTARMTHKIQFPFLVLLISGGHCLLNVAQNVNDFLLLGQCLDNAPGEAFDKVARRLKLKNLPECATFSGGMAIEHMAKAGNPTTFQFPVPMWKYQDCSFSFSGLQFTAMKLILEEEAKHGIQGGRVLPNVSDICASFQLAVVRHLLKRLQRAIIYCDMKKIIPPENRILVISGGVACNSFIRAVMTEFCNQVSFRVVCPPPELCTDNGIMIAWNGIERLLAGIGITHDLDSVDIEPQCPLGRDVSDDIRNQHIKLPGVKIDFMQIR